MTDARPDRGPAHPGVPRLRPSARRGLRALALRGVPVRARASRPTTTTKRARRRIAHYALVPAVYSRDGVETPFVFSLNACVDPTAQRGGYFTRMGQEVYAEAAARGVVGVVGVSNANSTPAVVNKLHWKLVGPMPVRVVVRHPRSEPGLRAPCGRRGAARRDRPRRARRHARPAPSTTGGSRSGRRRSCGGGSGARRGSTPCTSRPTSWSCRRASTGRACRSR